MERGLTQELDGRFENRRFIELLWETGDPFRIVIRGYAMIGQAPLYDCPACGENLLYVAKDLN